MVVTVLATALPPWLDLSRLPPSAYLGLALLGVVIGIPVVLFGYLLVTTFAGSTDRRDAGRLLPLLNLVVLLIAYAFYRADQPRTLAEALRDIVSAGFGELLPSAAATGAVLLCLFWLVIATITRLPRRIVLAPVESLLLGMIASSAVCVLFTVVWMNLLAATTALDAGAAVAAMCLLWLVWGGIAVLDDSNPNTVLGRAASREALRALSGRTDPAPPPPRPRLSASTYLRRTVITALSTSAIAAVITVVVLIARGDSPPPTVEDVVRVELTVFAVAFVVWCLTLRSATESLPGVPAVLTGFTNLSLALSTVLIAATGAATAPVLLGPVPPLLVAVLPGLITAVAVYLVDVRPHRRTARAYGTCLAVSVLAAVLGPVVRPGVSAVVDAAFAALPLLDV